MKRILFIIASCILSVSTLSATNNSPNNGKPQGGTIVGKIIDSRNDNPIEYANITIFSAKDSSLITGGITDNDGRFKIDELTPGKYYATYKFIGYVTSKTNNITITAEERMVRIGVVKLEASAQNLNELNVVADKQQVVYKIDKKVVNPSQFLAAQGGSAVDILSNTPSVAVDLEGNVTMRGSSNFMVLVNGKPTPFDASDALAQIPASSIENIEIITNPSAKYDPDGAAGIINIITKKNSLKGWNGIANASVNTLGSYSGDFLFNFTGEKSRWFIGASRSDRLRAAEYSSASGTIDENGDTSHIVQTGDREMGRYNNSIKTGFSYDFNDKNTATIELKGGQSGRRNPSELENKEWSTGTVPTMNYANTNTDAKGTFGAITLSQTSQFGDNKEHKLESSLYYQHYVGDDNTSSYKYDDQDSLLSSQVTWEEDYSNELRFKTDYTRPWEKGKMEAGYQLRLDDSWSNYDAEFDGTYDDTYYNELDFYRLVNSAYATFSGEEGQFGYQLGLRGEYTLRQLEEYDGTLHEIDRMDWYPSVHLSYNMTADQSIMSSYTRRIDRPRDHYLDPYLSWRDPNSIRQGNPALSPQYINSYEVSYQKRFGNNFFSVELFHRNVQEKIERVQERYDDAVILSTYENIGQDFSTGAEFMLNYNITKWWTANLSASLYDYRLDVNPEFESSVNETQSNNWKARLSNTFKATPTLRLQFDAMYRSPTITATGTRSSMTFTSLAVKKSFFNRKLDAGISVMDVFNTANMQVQSSGDSFYSDYKFDMKSPTVQFTISYIFNNYKPERSRGEGDGMEMEF